MPKLIDLSHPLEHEQLGFPSAPKVTVTAHNTLALDGYNLARISMGTHQGTHLDVPYHFFDDGKTMDQMPLERFYDPAVLVDLAPGSCLAAGTPIVPKMFEPHADKFHRGAKVIYRTGWHRTFGTPEHLTDFPTLTVESARWIADYRIGLLGMDTPTPSTDWKNVHLALLNKDVGMVIVEGLTGLDKLPERFTFVGFPLNIKGGDGSPIRAVAVVDF